MLNGIHRPPLASNQQCVEHATAKRRWTGNAAFLPEILRKLKGQLQTPAVQLISETIVPHKRN